MKNTRKSSTNILEGHKRQGYGDPKGGEGGQTQKKLRAKWGGGPKFRAFFSSLHLKFHSVWSLAKKFLVSPKSTTFPGTLYTKKKPFVPPKKVAPRGDERCIEVVASGLPQYHSAQLAVDFTMRCVVSSSGKARPGAAAVALETGGRWSPEALALRVSFGPARGRPTQSGAVGLSAWRWRWYRMLSVSSAKAFATSLLFGRRALHAVSGADGNVPDATGLFLRSVWS